MSHGVLNRDQVADEDWIREALLNIDLGDALYIAPNHYDGGYELQVGGKTLFLEYYVIDSKDWSWLQSKAKSKLL